MEGYDFNDQLIGRTMSDKIKVLMLGPDRGVHGGISALVNSYYEAGIEEKIDLEYIGTMKEGNKLKKLAVALIAYIRFLTKLGWCDIVHVNFSSDSSFMRKSLFIRTAKRHGKKILLHQHGGDFINYYNNQISESRRKYVRDTLDMGDIMLVLTESWRVFFSSLTDGSRIRVLPNGIVTSDAGADPTVAKNMEKILFLGRICVDKGVRELIDATKKLHEENENVRLYIGGIYEDGKLREEIEKNSGFIEYLGWVSGEKKNRYLDECGIVALPSYYEGMPVLVIEGMLHGCCVVASNVGGIPDIIENEVDGLIIPAGDSDALRKAFERVMKDKDLADRLSCNGVKKAVEKYSMEKLLNRLLDCYSSILKKNL